MKGSTTGSRENEFGFIDFCGYADNFLSDRKISDYLRNRASMYLFFLVVEYLFT